MYSILVILSALQAALAVCTLGVIAFLEVNGLLYGVGAFLGLIVLGMMARLPNAGAAVEPETAPGAWRWTLLIGGILSLFAVVRTSRLPTVVVLFAAVSIALAFVQWYGESTSPYPGELTSALRPVDEEGATRLVPAGDGQVTTPALATPNPVAGERKRGPFDFLLVIWMLNLIVGPFGGWLVTSFVDLEASNWRTPAAVRAILCIVVPAICVIPGFWYLRRPYVFAGLLILALGTGFQMATGLGAAGALLSGPRIELVTVLEVEVLTMHRPNGGLIRYLILEDGRRLFLPERILAHKGAMRLTILPGLDRILGGEPA